MAVARPPIVFAQFEDHEQQKESYIQGMWLFLATEVLFFGGLFTGYLVYRTMHGAAFHEASRELHLWLGALNTGILLLSSLTMALAIHFAELDRRRPAVALLGATMVLGFGFLCVKSIEYRWEYLDHRVPGFDFVRHPDEAPSVQLLYSFYFAMTGLHAIHMIIGLIVVGIMTRFLWKGRLGTHHLEPLEMTGLYWHFVDIIWIFLFPLLYLMGYPK